MPNQHMVLVYTNQYDLIMKACQPGMQCQSVLINQHGNITQAICELLTLGAVKDRKRAPSTLGFL